MDKKTARFFRASIVSVVAICIIVFVGLTIFMSKKTEETVSEISTAYMSEMSKQIQQKFQAIVNLRLSQVEGIILRTPPESAVYGEQMLKELTYSNELRNFTYLAFLTEDGELKKIAGEEIELFDKENIEKSLKKDGSLVAQGRNHAEEKMLLLGKEASYPMEDGRRSIALVAGIEMSYLDESLFFNGEEEMVYFHIIDINGNFVIRNSTAYRENYFQRIRDRFETYRGKDAETYVRELYEAMSERENYSEVVFLEGNQRRIYCAPLAENSTWYLVCVMSDETMGRSITKLDTFRLCIMVGSGIAILLTMSIIFVVYFRLSEEHMNMLVEARKEADRANKAKSEFLSSMSHDIRTPMNAIIGMTEIALKNLQDMARVEDCLQKVKLSSKHLLGLINDVLDMSKIESGKMTLNMVPMSLRSAMNDIVNIIQPQVKARGQYFDIFIQKISWEDVYCDGMRLNQVLLNLLSNAVKFTPEGKRIDVHMYQEPSPQGDDFIRTHFRVIDTGIGMSEEFQKKIFDTFTREETNQVNRITGTGLGMAITKSIVDLMGGTIELISEKGKGSDFHITVDLRKAVIKEGQMELPPWHILVVDDNEQLCLSAAANLEELGVHAEWTVSGKEAVKMVGERHKRDDDYHFVLIDRKMPEMDGIQVIHEIRSLVGKKIPIFLISAYDWNDVEDEAIAASLEGFISKPLFKSTLYERLSQYVEGHSKEDKDKSQQEVDFNGKKVLLAEDMDINWEVANAILSEMGLVLERAVNGKECLEMFESSEEGYYDAILMDIRMPIMNGYDATIAIRALERPDNSLPIIAMTADAFSDDARHCLEVGMNAHIPKPLDIQECMRVLEDYLGQ